MKNLAIFGSGSGSNAENICLYFKRSKIARVSLICSNKSEAYIAKRAKRLSVDFVSFEKNFFNSGLKVIRVLKNYSIDYVILAGFLLKIPKNIISLYSQKIINIHPSLLPKFKGLNTFSRMLKNKEIKAGCTVHYVNAKIDSGIAIVKKSFFIKAGDDEFVLKKKTQKLEYNAYPEAIIKIFRDT